VSIFIDGCVNWEVKCVVCTAYVVANVHVCDTHMCLFASKGLWERASARVCARTCVRVLHVGQLIHIYPQTSHIYICQKATYIRKRALYIRKKTLYIYYDCSNRVCVCSFVGVFLRARARERGGRGGAGGGKRESARVSV